MRRAILLTLLLVLTSAAQAATTITVDPGGADTPPNYLSLSAAEAALPDPLTDNYIISCSGSTNDTTAAVINVATLNGATQYTLAITGNWASGIFDDSKYHLKMSVHQTQPLTITANYVTVEKIQVTGGPSPYSYSGICISANNSNVVVRNCYVANCLRTNYAGIQFAAGTGTARTAYNNLCVGNYAGIKVFQGGRGDIYHNTVIGGTYGVHVQKSAGMTYTVQNNLISGAATACYLADLTGVDVTIGANYTSDATSPDGASYQSKTFTFIGGEDYHLNANQDTLYPCSDPSITGLTTDIDGETRQWGTVGEAGADEIPTTATYVPPFTKWGWSRRRH